MPGDTADMYSENPAGDTPPADDTTGQTDSATDTTDQNKDGEAGDTFLVSKDNLGGTDPQPGDVCTFKVERVHEGEVEFSWVKDDNENKESNPEKDKANSEIDSMAA